MFRWLRKTPAPAPGAEPQTINHYRLTRKLGEGGMGVVYEAYDERLDRPVAIKRLRASRPTRPRERLSREARVAAGVSHPNVCQVYELGEYEGELYIVMELLAGETLAQRIGQGAAPALAESLQITLGVLAALEALHSRGIVHRDLKPSNIFLTPHGPKLLDFGVARPRSTDELDPGADGSGYDHGNAAVPGAELLGAEPPTPAADLFAMGAILFEMLTGAARVWRCHGAGGRARAACTSSRRRWSEARMWWRSIGSSSARSPSARCDRYPDAARDGAGRSARR